MPSLLMDYDEELQQTLLICQQEKYDSSCDANDIDERDFSQRKVIQ